MQAPIGASKTLSPPAERKSVKIHIRKAWHNQFSTLGRGVAQLGSARELGSRGPRFKSGRPDQFFLWDAGRGTGDGEEQRRDGETEKRRSGETGKADKNGHGAKKSNRLSVCHRG